jgi:hypothetical protein
MHQLVNTYRQLLLTEDKVKRLSREVSTCIRLGTQIERSRNSSISVETRLQAGRPGFESRQDSEIISPLHRVQTGSGAHPTSYPVDSRDSFLGDIAVGA